MNVYAKQKNTHGYRKQTCGYQSGKGRREGQIQTLGLTDTNYYLTQINNKNTLYSTGNYSHCLVTSYNGV